MANFSISFDQKSLSEIAQFVSFPVYISNEVATALAQASQLLAQDAQNNTWSVFANPSGQLADSIVPFTTSPYEAGVTVGVPYGHRREMGFSGADSLNRVYNDPPYYYMTTAMDTDAQQILQMVEQAAMNALAKIGGA